MFTAEEIEKIIIKKGNKIKLSAIVRDNLQTIKKLKDDGYTFKQISDALSDKYKLEIRYQSLAGTYIRITNELEH